MAKATDTDDTASVCSTSSGRSSIYVTPVKNGSRKKNFLINSTGVSTTLTTHENNCSAIGHGRGAIAYRQMKQQGSTAIITHGVETSRKSFGRGAIREAMLNYQKGAD